uniref:Uncharacterized protein n=1 Tax=Caenorhabditis japonica TaxID=281687 RepID=A0A8R1IZZ0_CAEJA
MVESLLPSPIPCPTMGHQPYSVGVPTDTAPVVAGVASTGAVSVGTSDGICRATWKMLSHCWWSREWDDYCSTVGDHVNDSMRSFLIKLREVTSDCFFRFFPLIDVSGTC